VASELEALSGAFPKEVERQLDKGGTSLTYIPVSEVIARLNDVLGVFGWSYTMERCERDILDPDYLVAHVRMTVGETIRDGVGGQKIKRTRAGDIVDLGDEYKGAVSDALKKAAQSFGVGLYLARSHSSPVSAGQHTRMQGDTTVTEYSNLASDKQQNMIRAVCKSMGKVPPANLQAMSKREASAYIDTLKSGEQAAPQYDTPEEPF
jgi:recombination DNA repair RAD52 pathway protein